MESVDDLNDLERTDFALWLLLAHGAMTWECDHCDCLTNSLVLAGAHMLDDHPELVRDAKAKYPLMRL